LLQSAAYRFPARLWQMCARHAARIAANLPARFEIVIAICRLFLKM
jgi:hypothetical protein